MKAWTFPFLFFSIVSVAQPGDPSFLRYLDPCGIPPNDSIDIANDGIPDLVIGGLSVGTDDVPSSSGNCSRVLSTLPGTTLLCSTDRNGQREPHAFAVGDTVPGVDTLVRNDLQIPRFVHTDGNILAVHWRYGNNASGPVVPDGLDRQVFVFHTIEQGRTVHGTFTIEAVNGDPSVRIRTGTLALAEEPLIVR